MKTIDCPDRLSFDDEDLLLRREYAEFLIDLIRNSNDYTTETKALHVCLNALYGMGKTTFLNKLISLLEDTWCSDATACKTQSERGI